MSKLNTTFGATLPALLDPVRITKRDAHGLSAADYRPLPSELRLRPPSQRAFTRKLLHRALLHSADTEFPVTIRVVPDPAGPS